MIGRRGALLFLVAGVLLGVWLFRDARRVNIRFPIAGAGPCAEVLRLELGTAGAGGLKVERTLSLRLDGPPLPPWSVSLRGREWVLRGELRCRSGHVERLGERPVEVRDEGEVVVDLDGRCRCARGPE
ncbi:MAG: hypothetical protein AAFU79_23150 [Myxococcota bacterium]